MITAQTSGVGKEMIDVTFDTVTASSALSAGRYYFKVDGTEAFAIDDFGPYVLKDEARSFIKDTSSSAVNKGGRLALQTNDGAAMGSGHGLGTIEFTGAEDSSGNMTVGAKIHASTDTGWSTTENGASLEFYTTDGNASQTMGLSINSDSKSTFYGAINSNHADGVTILNATTSAANQGGKLILLANDEAAMGNGHRLGVIEFKGAENDASSLQIGARIEALTDATWEAEVENGASLKFYTTDAVATESLVLTLNSDKHARFEGAVTAVGALTANSIDIDTGGADINGTLEANTITIGGTNIMTGSLLTTAGTISAGIWRGTKVDKAYTEHVTHYRFMGYSVGDGSNYEFGVSMGDNQAICEHGSTSSGDGLTITAGSGTNVSELIRNTGGHVMVNAATLNKWAGWGTYNGTDNAYVALFKWTPVDDDSTNVNPVLLDIATIDGEGNDKVRSWGESSFTQASVAAGDIIFTQVKTETSGKTVYFNSTLEIAW